MNRRSFLKGLGAGLASLTFSSCTYDDRQESAKPTPKLDPNSSLDQMVAFLRNHREKDINYETLWPANYRIISFGENHSVNDERDITDNLGLYYRQGATHLAIEKPTGFQPVVHQYLQNSILDDEFLSKLKDGSFFPENGTFEVIRKARDLGMKVVCMDFRFPEITSRWDELNERNKHMASVLTNILEKEKNARIVAHCGAGHFSYTPVHTRIDGTTESILPVHTYLLERGMSTFKVMYAGQLKVTDSEIESYKDLDKTGKLNPKQPSRVIGVAAKLAGVDQEKFGICLDDTVTARNWGNYIIHLPQK